MGVSYFHYCWAKVSVNIFFSVPFPTISNGFEIGIKFFFFYRYPYANKIKLLGSLSTGILIVSFSVKTFFENTDRKTGKRF